MQGFDARDHFCCPRRFDVVTIARGVQALDEAKRELCALVFRQREHDLEQRGFTHDSSRVHRGDQAVQLRAVTTPAELDRALWLLATTSQAGHLEDDYRVQLRARAAVMSIAEPGGIRFRSAARWIRRAQTPSRALRLPRGSSEDARVAVQFAGDWLALLRG
jgi:hypothetical protein